MTLPIAAQGINCEAFEADPDVFMLLADNIALSGFADRVRVHNTVLYDTERSVEF